jgi:uncharacterized protein (DUF2141 family)
LSRKIRLGIAPGLGLAIALAVCGVAAAAPTATLTIKVLKVSPQGGDLRVALYDEATYQNDDAEPVAGKVVPARAPETDVVLEGIAPGTYAVKLFQDVNRNGKFDLSWLGVPLEKFGFSNDAQPLLSEPGFGRTKFNLAPGANTIIIHLQ